MWIWSRGGGSCRVWRDNLCVEASEQNQKFRFGIYRFLLKVVHVNLIKRVGWGGVGGGGGARIPWQPVGRAFSQLTTAAFDAANNHWFPACQGLKTCTLSRNQNTIGLLAKKCCSPRVSFVGMLKTKLRMPLWIKWGAEWGVRKNKQEDAKLEWGDRIC